MRPASRLGGLVLAALLGSVGAVRAEPYDATVYQETDVRCGHGDGAMFYPTNHLHVGDRVRVVKEEDGGWLAIVPPSGSFSWVRKDLLYINNQQQPPLVVVNLDADVRVGSGLTKDPPLVIGKRVARGTIITPLPKVYEITDGEGTWLAIYPPDGELRYIRKEAVQKPESPAPTTVAAGPPGQPAVPAQDAEALYRQAVEAEKWNPQAAVALYTQGATSDANADRRLQALNRANWLRENLRNPTTPLVPGPTPGADVAAAPPPSESKVYPLTAGPTTPPTVHLSPPQAAAVPPPAANAAAPAYPPGAPNEYSTHPGWLQTSGRAVEGRKTYVMVSDRGVPFYYVTAQPGVNLEAYVRKRVECYGQAIYDGELRANYMRVSRVEVREGP